MEKKTGKKLSKFMSKLGSFVHKPKPVYSNNDYELPSMPGLSPLSAANNPLARKKQQQLSVAACRAQDDCSQIQASSDQASQVARIEEQPQDSYASEHYGSECSLSESVRAASAHMAQLRTILVNHISETHDARSTNGELAGPNLLAALHREQQQCSSSLEHLSGFSGRRSTSSRLPPGSPSTDCRVEALLADQMQLLDLVQTLIADHRNSLLERQRLQQQLAATQEALHSERLDKDRAAALAHVRSEEVSKVQADLAAASATVLQLRAKRAISIKQVQLPSALAAAAAEGVNAEESILSDTAEKPSAGGSVGSVQQKHTPSRTSAIIGRIAPEDSWQDMAAIVGPAPVNSSQGPLSAGAAAAAPLALNSSKASSSRQGKSSKHRSKAARVSGGKAGGNSGVSHQNADLQGPREPRQRRLLGDTPSSSNKSGDAAGAVAVAAAPVAGNATNVGGLPQTRDSRSSQESLQSPGDASVHVQVVQQQQVHQQPVPAEGATAPSAAARIAQKQASALELLLLQRLNHSSCPADANAQLRQLLHNSIETETSSLSVAWAGAAGDAAAAAAGLTKQQLHQLLHRPWLPNGTQGSQASVLSPEQSAALYHAGSSAAAVAGDAAAGTSTAAAAAACPATGAAAGTKRKQWQLPFNTRGQGAAAGSGHAGSDGADSCSSVEQDSESESELESDGDSIESGSDSDTCSEDSDDGLDSDHDSDGSNTSRSDVSSSGCRSMEAVELQTDARKTAAAAAVVGSSGRTAAEAVATAGGRHPRQQQQLGVNSSPASHKHGSNVHSSNGSSWPGMKASMFASNSNTATLAAAHPGCKPSPSACKRTQKQNRSRSQPVQISTSLESAETLSLATTVQHGPGSRSASHSSSLATVAAAAAACPRCSTDAATCACSCFAAVPGRGRGRGSRGSGVGSSSGRMAAKRSAELLQPCSEENQGISTHKRKLAPDAAAAAASQQQTAGAAAAAAAGGASRQRQRVTQQQQKQPSTHAVLQTHARLSPQPSGTAASPSAAAAAAADHGCDSDGEMSVASAATGCTTLSNLAGIDLQIRSQVKPRPAIVPKLDLPLMAQQQQQQRQQGGGKQAVNVDAAGAPGKSSRALRLAQQSDMAPLMAQPGSSRTRGKNTPRSALEAACAAGNAGTLVERAGGSFSSAGAAGSVLGVGAMRAQSFTAGQLRQQQGLAAAAAAAGQTAPSSPAHSTRSKHSSAPGSGNHAVTAAAVAAGTCTGGGVGAARGGSANGSSGGAGHYWGSSAGSYPASEEPSRQPTPTGEFAVPIYIPAAAGLPTNAGAAVGLTAAGAPVSVLSSAVGGRSAAVADADSAAAAEGDEVASEGAGSTNTAYDAAAQQFYQPVPAAQQTAQMLTITTPRGASLTPRGLTPSSAAAAAAGSYMTMRPAHMYKSVSTVYAMYSPLRGGLRAFGQTKPVGANGPGACSAAAALSAEAAGQAAGAEAFGVATLEQHPQQQQLQVLGTAGMLGVREPSTGNASEHHWHALLGTVPEEEGVLYCEAVHDQLASAAAAAVATDSHSSLGPAAAAAAGVAATTLAAGVLVDSRQGSLGTAAILSSPSPISGGSDSEPCYYIPNAAGLPTRQDFQLMVQQEQQQQQQRLVQQERLPPPAQQQQQAEKDVVDRGPLFRPDSVSPPPAAQAPVARRSTTTRSSGRQQQCTSRQQQRSSLTIQTTTTAVTEAEGTAVGPLTASSPTRRRNNTSSSSVHAAIRSSAGEVIVQQQQQQHRRQQQQQSLRQPRESTTTYSRGHGTSHGRGRSSQDAGVSAATVARVEAAAAAVAARVAAVAARQSSRRQEHNVDAEELSSPEAVDAAGFQSATAAAASSGTNQAEEQQQQQDRSSTHHSRPSATRSRSASREQRHLQSVKQRHRQQQQQQLAGSSASVDPSSRRNRRTGSGSSSSRHIQGAGAINTHSSSTSNLLDSRQASTEMVTSYHNPLVTLEDAGLGADDDAALVYAGLVPGFAPGVTGAAALPAAGVAAAAVNQVPAHVTPLAKERSREGASSKDGSVAQEQSGAGGQLHWNPLYDPDAMETSPTTGFAQ